MTQHVTSQKFCRRLSYTGQHTYVQMRSDYFLSVFWPGVLLHPRYSPESLAEAGLVSMESGTCISDTGLSHMCVIKFLTEGMSLKLVRPCLGLHPDSAGYRLRDPEQGANTNLGPAFWDGKGMAIVALPDCCTELSCITLLSNV